MSRRQELLSVPHRKWDAVLHNVGAVYIIPSRRKHESGYMCMDFVACEIDKRGHISNNKIRFGGGCDVVNIEGIESRSFNIDCIEGGIIRIFSHGVPFGVSEDVSSVRFTSEIYKDGFSFDDVPLEKEGKQ